MPGTQEWNQFTRVRTGFSTVDLGEDQSIAIALAERDRGKHLPIVTYDDSATKKARELGLATVSFLETLAWLLGCELVDAEQAAQIEARAAARDGWKRPANQTGDLDALAPELRQRLLSWQPPPLKKKR